MLQEAIVEQEQISEVLRDISFQNGSQKLKTSTPSSSDMKENRETVQMKTTSDEVRKSLKKMSLVTSSKKKRSINEITQPQIAEDLIQVKKSLDLERFNFDLARLTVLTLA